MNGTDPKRLSTLENVPELSDALEAARERLPSPSTLDALRARVEAAAGASVAAPPKSWPVALKIVLPVLGVAAAVIGVQRFTERPVALRPSIVASGTAVLARPVPPVVEPAPNSTLALPRPVASASAPARVGVAPAVVSAVASAPLPAPSVQVPSELDIIKEAGQVLKSDPTRALQLTMDHARLYSSGALAEEREVIAIEALARLGRLSAARARAERFLLFYPRSAHLSRIQQVAGLDAKVDAGDQNNPTPPALDQP
ncbi:MAG TPA: hypothetical protein VHM25_23185 [Polyangiaceae bacterium]|jgi:hypothetical protein|nr:hypothetical protein [Polyangiaceae bacterium]